MRIILLACVILSSAFALVDEMGNIGPQNSSAAAAASGPSFAELNWESKTAMPTARFGMAVAATRDLLYAVGGYGSARLTINEVYDPAGDTWATHTSMANARNGCYGAALDGWIYVVGGYNGSVRLNIVEGYDVTGDSWYTLPLMSVQRTVPAAVGWNGKLYVFGGFDGTNYHRMVERYDPASNTWDTVAPLPTGRSGLAACELDGKIYVMGGWTGAEPTRTEFEMYDPAGDSWTTLPPLPTGRMYLTAAALSGYVLAIGGQLTFNGPQTDIVEVYDPVAGDWSSANPMLAARGSLGAATIGDETYAVGGWTGSTALAENDGGKIQTGITAGPSRPRAAELSVRPNPAGPAGVIRFSLPDNTGAALKVRDATGRLVRTLKIAAGQSDVTWNRVDAVGKKVVPGIYFCSTENTYGVSVTKLVIAR